MSGEEISHENNPIACRGEISECKRALKSPLLLGH